MPRDIDEDLIEATIRRVAESKAAREAPQIEMPVADAIAPDIETATVEQAIEKAESEAAPAPALDDDDGDDIQVTPTPLMAASRGRGVARPASISAPAAAAAREPLAARAILDGDSAVAVQLAEIKQQLDAVLGMLREMRAGSAPSIGPAWEKAAAASSQRPAIFREDARPAVRDLEPEIIDTRPIPEPLPPLHVEEPKRGFDLLPRSYRITVEDKRRGVDLVPLHRALLSMDGVRDMSLLSYNNGIAIVALETTEELEADALGAQVSRAMSRGAKVEVHNEHTMVVKLADE